MTNRIIEKVRQTGVGTFLHAQGATKFSSLDASDVAAWLRSQGYTVESNCDKGTNGLATTTCGICVSTNGYVYTLKGKEHHG